MKTIRIKNFTGANDNDYYCCAFSAGLLAVCESTTLLTLLPVFLASLALAFFCPAFAVDNHLLLQAFSRFFDRLSPSLL
ncbi:hypothetical protein [Duffyella gerundensis]|uniref:hypothetical protein n=1 Tax=Duffyella gerundensis TaxID=1619313 RepID=UPI003FD03EAB